MNPPRLVTSTFHKPGITLSYKLLERIGSFIIKLARLQFRKAPPRQSKYQRVSLYF